jgi:rubrerythrin
MNMIAALDLAIEIEEGFFNCYSQMSKLFTRANLSGDFYKLAQEELGHVNLIKTSKKYVFQAPEAFDQDPEFVKDMQRGLDEINLLLSDLRTKEISLEESLDRMYALETNLEKVHIDTMMQINDSSVKRLFTALCEGDKAHRARLTAILERQGRPVKA